MGGKKAESRGTWLAANQQLFRSDAGISVPQFDLQDVHPFIGARRFNQVWVDAGRNTILGTALAPSDSSSLGEYVVLAPTESLAQSQLHLVKLSPSGAELQFSAPGGTASPANPLMPASRRSSRRRDRLSCGGLAKAC
jgi:hypothetical protein